MNTRLRLCTHELSSRFQSFRRSAVMLALLLGIALIWVGYAVATSPGSNSSDWPAYLHDNARSGVCPAAPDLPLAEHWAWTSPAPPHSAWPDPHSVAVEGMGDVNLERPRLKFDDAFHIAVSDGAVYFGSTEDNKVCCIDLASGEVRWTFFTDGPVRLAPTVYKGRIYVGADDGYVYCLNAADGELVWKFQAAPSDERVLGSGKMMSLWPVRTGVVVDDDVAYFGAGMFPGERVYVYAVGARDGAPIWKNATMSDLSAGQHGFTPQGYLLATEDYLFVPSGRALPARFDRKDGRFHYQRSFGWRSNGVVGGTYALLAGEQFFCGGKQTVGYDQEKGNIGFAWFPGHRLVITREISYLLENAGIQALDRIAYPKANAHRKQLANKRRSLVRQKATTENFDEKLAALTQQEKAADAAMAACTKWRLEAEGLDSMIVAGEVLLAGGDNQVLAIESNTGEQLCTARTDGKAKGLAVADGRLLVSTDKGTIQCFGKGPKPTSAAAETVSDPYPRDQLTLYYQRAAQLIVRSSGVEKGYCLVLGCGTGRLAYELAKRTDLVIYGIEPDAKKVEIARERLDAAGMYGNRITVEQAALDAVPYSNYFANLIVSEEALISGRLSTPADEAMRMLKPCGGVLCIGQPATRADIVKPLSAEALNNWVSSAGISQELEPTDSGGTWLNFARGPLQGAGKWTHQYGDPGNTASSEDTLVKAPLRVLWYGEPGPGKVPSRHYRNTAPLSINGRVFLQGINRIMCFDAYNGFMHWEREIEGAYRVRMARECSNLACNEDSLFVATGSGCLRLDAATGLTQATYEMPASEDETERTWAYVAVVDNLLFGSTSAKSQTSDSVFAVDIETGELKWVHHGKNIRNNTIAIDDGRVFFADDRATEEQRQVGLKQMAELVEEATGSDAPSAAEAATDADVRMVVALDAATGEVAWEQPADLTDCGGTLLFSICNNGVLVFAGSYINGHYWKQFLGGDYASRRATALSTRDGSLLWSKAVGCRIRPLVIGDTFYAEPWRFDLHTGEQQMRTNPVTGETVPWKFERPGHHCGCISGSPNALFFRSWTSAYYDLLSDHGTQHFGGQRPGCWINMIPANGLVIEPEASSGCACLHSLTATVVFEPCATNRMWGVYSSAGETTPVKHLAINVGGPGDRKDKDGELWLAYPRPRGRMLLSFKMETEILPECGYFNYGEEDWGAVNADTSWLYASGCAGMTSCTLPLVKEEDGPARYTVRLGFADSENTRRGKRVFDIKLQGKGVAKNFDVVAAAGGQNKAVIEEFNGIEVEDNLNIELVPKGENTPRDQAPILNTIEVIRE